ncbi:glycerate kinase [Cohnella kolymensis]|uniref:Glycerate kinase n=1 Tax=Cohnella kolymensis TaxID=1590652 RepID=A0ABR5A3R6_9BACL|nr:glycerate kinase [Cohnella kolymensis]KIL35685.1 glycerate kinase [Cohnella kolymensis]
MKIVLAPDSYKGSITAKEACNAMEEGIRRVLPDAEIIHHPMADGGEGTVQSLVDATGGTIYEATVMNPIGEPVAAKYGVLGDRLTAVIEMAEASGLYLIPADRRNPMITTTYGTGELIMDAVNRGCRKFIIGLGGSATNDGGTGMAQALGIRFLDGMGQELPGGGGSLNRLYQIDMSGLDPRIRQCSFTAACDVDNPLYGSNGASSVYGPQKGASPEMIAALDDNLRHLAAIIEKCLGKSIANVPGAGAAGGLGAGIVAFLKGVMQKGVDIVIEATGLEAKLRDAHLVLCGEGQCDAQTALGKTPFGVAQLASKRSVPVILIAGSVGQGAETLYKHGVTSIFSMVNGPLSLEAAMLDAPRLLSDITERIMRVVVFGRGDAVVRQ